MLIKLQEKKNYIAEIHYVEINHNNILFNQYDYKRIDFTLFNRNLVDRIRRSTWLLKTRGQLAR